MFKYITDMEHNFNFKGQDTYLAQFNPDTNLFIVENENGDSIGEVNLFKNFLFLGSFMLKFINILN